MKELVSLVGHDQPNCLGKNTRQGGSFRSCGLAVVLDFERRVCFDAYLSSGVDLEGIAAVGESPVSVKKSGKDGGEEFDGIFRLQDHHIKSAVAWLIDVGHRNAELNLGEINQQHTQAFRFDGLAIDGEHDGGMLRNYIGSCCEKIRNGTEALSIIAAS